MAPGAAGVHDVDDQPGAGAGAAHHAGGVDAVADRLVQHLGTAVVVADDADQLGVEPELRQRDGLVRALPAERLATLADVGGTARSGHGADPQGKVAGDLAQHDDIHERRGIPTIFG